MSGSEASHEDDATLSEYESMDESDRSPDSSSDSSDSFIEKDRKRKRSEKKSKKEKKRDEKKHKKSKLKKEKKKKEKKPREEKKDASDGVGADNVVSGPVRWKWSGSLKIGKYTTTFFTQNGMRKTRIYTVKTAKGTDQHFLRSADCDSLVDAVCLGIISRVAPGYDSLAIFKDNESMRSNVTFHIPIPRQKAASNGDGEKPADADAAAAAAVVDGLVEENVDGVSIE